MPIYIADALIVRDNALLMVQQGKTSSHGLWSFPGGHLEEGESFVHAALREVQEEIGVQLQEYSPYHVYTFSERGVDFELHSFTGSFTGEIILEDELLDYRWFTLEEIRAAKLQLRGKVTLEQAESILGR